MSKVLVDLNGRDEPVSVYHYDGFQYRFVKDEHGDKICDVRSNEHVSMMLSGGGFAAYVPPEQREGAEKEDWDAFVKEWKTLPAEKYVGQMVEKPLHGSESMTEFVPGYVYENIDRFNQAPKEIRDKAIDKFNRMVDVLNNPKDGQPAPENLVPKIWPGIK